MAQITRRSFLKAAAATGVVAGLAACSNSTGGAGSASDEYMAPDTSAYPIDPDGDDVEALYQTEKLRAGWTRSTNPNGVEIGVMDTAKLIQVDGLAFRDMNGNGKLDLWEDWRQDAGTRAAALAEELPAEECVKLMFHGGDTDMSDANAEQYNLVKAGSRAGVSRLSSTIDSYASDVKWINEVQQICEESEWGIPYLNSTDPYQLFNIPDNIALASTLDPDTWRKAGMWLARAWHATGVRCLLGPQVDVYSQPLGCRLSSSVSEDPALNRDFCKAFAGGLQSTWGDDDATDDQGWGKDSVAAMLKHFAGEGSVEGGRNDHADPGRYNVFPGNNFNAHLIPFLDGGLHLDSSTGQAAAMMPCYGVAYSDDERYGELVGSAYNKRNLSILRNAGWDGMVCTDWQVMTSETYGVASLSEPERFQKLVDAGDDQYGGGYLIDDGNDGYQLLVNELGETDALARVRESARRVAKLMIDVSLFEEPYSDPEYAKQVLESDAGAAFGEEASEKAIVMLKNAGNVISNAGLGDKPKVYLPLKQKALSNFAAMMGGSSDPTFEAAFDTTAAADLFDVVTDTVDNNAVISATADDLAAVQYAIVKVSSPIDANDGVTGGVTLFGVDTGQPREYHPITLQYRHYTADGPNVRQESIAHVDEDGNYDNRSYYGKSTTANNESDLDFVIDVKSRLPEGAKLILLVEASRPMVFSEIEPYADAILYVGVQNESSQRLPDEAWESVITGKVEPTGVLVYQQPQNMDTVEASQEDVPRDLECYTDSEGNTYDFCFGLNWSGVIDDDRTGKYKAEPLTQPETEVSPDE